MNHYVQLKTSYHDPGFRHVTSYGYNWGRDYVFHKPTKFFNKIKGCMKFYDMEKAIFLRLYGNENFKFIRFNPLIFRNPWNVEPYLFQAKSNSVKGLLGRIGVKYDGDIFKICKRRFMIIIWHNKFPTVRSGKIRFIRGVKDYFSIWDRQVGVTSWNGNTSCCISIQPPYSALWSICKSSIGKRISQLFSEGFSIETFWPNRNANWRFFTHKSHV